MPQPWHLMAVAAAPRMRRHAPKTNGDSAMLVMVGYLIVIASVFGGFALTGGHLAAMLQPVELLMIGGAAIGAFVVGNSIKMVKATLSALPSCLKGSKYDKALYM